MSEIQSKKIVVPAEKLATAVEKHLLPGLLRHLNEKEKQRGGRTMFELNPEKCIDHNLLNEKVMKWVLAHQQEQDFNVITNTQGFGCRCEIESRYERGNTVFYRIDEEGQETSYFDYLWVLDSEYLIPLIPELTAEEKEELEDIQQVWVYYCPDCKEWAMDGENI